MQPTHIGPYTVLSRLGRGGMGAVYEATDRHTGETVAVKVLASHLADEHGLQKRFRDEIETLKSLRHPGIVQLLAFGEDDGQPYFAMELVRGKSLEHILRSGRRFTPHETIAMALEITRALKVAHDHGVVHRDLKPANLLIADNVAVAPVTGATVEPVINHVNHVKLADFGIAKLFSGNGHTAHGNIVGTAEYMAPEQAAGKPVDHRADLYALGLVMFAMLSGRPPFHGRQVTDVIEKQRREPPPRVASLVPNIPPELDELINRLLSKDPAARPVSALALSRMLMAVNALTEGAVEAPQSHSPGQPKDRPLQGSPPEDISQRRADAQQPGNRKPATHHATDHDRSHRLTVGGASSPEAADGRSMSQVDHYASTQSRTPSPNPGASDYLAEKLSNEAVISSPQPHPPIANLAGDLQPRQPEVAAQALVDFAATQPFTGKLPHVPTDLPTDAAGASTHVDGASRNRFTTIAELDRATRDHTNRSRVSARRWQIVTALATVASVAIGSYLLFQPLTADQLHRRIESITEQSSQNDAVDLRDAKPSIVLFLERFPDDPRATHIRLLSQTLDLDALERRSRRRVRGDKPLDPIERDYRAAMAKEGMSPSACAAALCALVALHEQSSGDSPSGDNEKALWLALVRRQIQRFEPLAAREQAEDASRVQAILAEASALKATAKTATDPLQRKDLNAQRTTLLESVVQLYAERPHAADAVATAKRALSELENEHLNNEK
ncbi:MAG: serine/threonine-protein kinase [Planctomycetota bacterium]